MNTQSFDLPDPHYQPEFYADVPLKRLISWAIDTVIIVLLVVLILPFTAFTGLFFLPLLAFLVNFAYRVICLANGSATLGMRLTAIEFRTREARVLMLSDALLHTLWLYAVVDVPHRAVCLRYFHGVPRTRPRPNRYGPRLSRPQPPRQLSAFPKENGRPITRAAVSYPYLQTLVERQRHKPWLTRAAHE